MTLQLPQAIHATAVDIGGAGVIICGPSGAGKSDLAVRLIDRGAILISDDQVDIHSHEDDLLLKGPAQFAGMIEVRSLGIVTMSYLENTPLRLKINLTDNPPRYPLDRQIETIMGRAITTISLNAFEHSAPIKAELALRNAIADNHL